MTRPQNEICGVSAWAHEPEPHKIAARTAEDIGNILTRERLRLLRSIREKTLESISELREGKTHVRKAPVVDCDALHITVPLSA